MNKRGGKQVAMQVDTGANAGAVGGGKDSGELKANTVLLDGIRKLAMDVRELDVDWIESIKRFKAKAMPRD